MDILTIWSEASTQAILIVGILMLPYYHIGVLLRVRNSLAPGSLGFVFQNSKRLDNLVKPGIS